MLKLTDLDIEVLTAIHTGTPLLWGAAVSVSLQYLKGHGLITDYIGARPRVTTAGRAALEKSNES